MVWHLLYQFSLKHYSALMWKEIETNTLTLLHLWDGVLESYITVVSVHLLSFLPLLGSDCDSSKAHWSTSSANSFTLLRTDLLTRSVCSSIKMPAILKTQTTSCLIFQHTVYFNKTQTETRLTSSCWSCWPAQELHLALGSSDKDFQCYTPTLESRARHRMKAWLCLGSGLEEIRRYLDRHGVIFKSVNTPYYHNCCRNYLHWSLWTGWLVERTQTSMMKRKSGHSTSMTSRSCNKKGVLDAYDQ